MVHDTAGFVGGSSRLGSAPVHTAQAPDDPRGQFPAFLGRWAAITNTWADTLLNDLVCRKNASGVQHL
jgi:hypothetical protein